jgi:hypothetical protein
MYSQNGTNVGFCRDLHYIVSRKQIRSFSSANVTDYTREHYLNGPTSTSLIDSNGL